MACVLGHAENRHPASPALAQERAGGEICKVAVVKYCQGARNERFEENSKTGEKKAIGAAKSMAVTLRRRAVQTAKLWWCRVARGFQPRPAMLTTIIWSIRPGAAPNQESE
jgi:hypothetical protein